MDHIGANLVPLSLFPVLRGHEAQAPVAAGGLDSAGVVARDGGGDGLVDGVDALFQEAAAVSTRRASARDPRGRASPAIG
jgi:hypothetical protein